MPGMRLIRALDAERARQFGWRTTRHGTLLYDQSSVATILLTSSIQPRLAGGHKMPQKRCYGRPRERNIRARSARSYSSENVGAASRVWRTFPRAPATRPFRAGQRIVWPAYMFRHKTTRDEFAGGAEGVSGQADAFASRSACGEAAP